MPDPCLASDLVLPELPCAGAAPKVTAGLLLLFGSQDFPPGKPHLGNLVHRVCDELRLGLYETSRGNCTILKITTRGQQNPGIQVRRVERPGNEGPEKPHSRQEGWSLYYCLTLIHRTRHTQKHTLLLLQNHLISVYSVISSRYSPLYPQYGKCWWFVSLAANSNYQGSSRKIPMLSTHVS